MTFQYTGRSTVCGSTLPIDVADQREDVMTDADEFDRKWLGLITQLTWVKASTR